MQKKAIAFCCVLLAGAAVMGATRMASQDKSTRPSPPAHAEFTFSDGKTIKVDYSSPRVKGRKIFGELEPYGKPWRAGANEATTFVTNTDLIVGGKDVPAGEYTIDIIPDETEWTLIVSKKTKNEKGGPVWGIPYPGEQFDLVRVKMKLTKLDSPVEDLLIAFDKMGSGTSLHLDWDTSRGSVDISEKM
jgi:hypothetical protein